MKKEEEITFSAGTVVLQYVCDDEHCIAVVVGDHMFDRLDDSDRKRFEMHRENKTQHILLVLSYFKQGDNFWSVFSKSKAFQFPTYIVQDKGTATKADLSTETALMIRHESEKVSRGLSYGRLHARMFNFSNKQLEALHLAALVDHYTGGGGMDDRPEWILKHSTAAETVLKELLIACPR